MNTDSLVKIKVKKGLSDKGWNKHLPVPLVDGELVFVHPDQNGVSPDYIRIIHSNGKNVSVFYSSHFENI